MYHIWCSYCFTFLKFIHHWSRLFVHFLQGIGFVPMMPILTAWMIFRRINRILVIIFKFWTFLEILTLIIIILAAWIWWYFLIMVIILISLPIWILLLIIITISSEVFFRINKIRIFVLIWAHLFMLLKINVRIIGILAILDIWNF